MIKTALITGITGQDGYYLTEFLLENGYAVHGLYHDNVFDHEQSLLTEFSGRITLHYGDMTDGLGLARLVKNISPDEIYNLAAQSHVAKSFDAPIITTRIIAEGTLNLLEIIRTAGKPIKFYQASSSEIFGNTPQSPQNENTPMNPVSPYGCAKLCAYHLVKTYRTAQGVFAVNGILFNHESPIRGHDFVTRKITRAVAGMKTGRNGPLKLGNLDARRDWGHARDYVRAMQMMMHHDTPDDFVIATGQTTSVRDFCSKAFACAGIDLEWQGQGTEEQGICAESGCILVGVDPALYRPNELHMLCGDAAKASNILGWTPEMSLDQLIEEMVAADSECFDS